MGMFTPNMTVLVAKSTEKGQHLFNGHDWFLKTMFAQQLREYMSASVYVCGEVVLAMGWHEPETSSRENVLLFNGNASYYIPNTSLSEVS